MQLSYFLRKAFIFQAKNLALITGAEVQWKVKRADTGNEYVFQSNSLLKRDVAVKHVAFGLQSKEDQRFEPVL